MQERGPRQPLNKIKRYILNALSSGLEFDELFGKIEGAKGLENTVFPDYYGRLMLERDINELRSQGFIKNILVTAPQGQRELEEDLRKRTAMRSQTPRQVENVVVQMPRPVQVTLPKESAKPKEEPKKKEKETARIKDLRDLGKIKGQFRED